MTKKEIDTFDGILRKLTGETFWMRDLQPWDVESLRYLDVMLENWPSRYKGRGEVDDNVVVIDIFTCSEERLQDMLTRTMSMINDRGNEEIGGRPAEKKRLTQAWKTVHLLRYNAKWQRRYADILQGLTISLTFAAILTSVVYSHFRSQRLYEANGNSSPLLPEYDSLLRGLNIILPLAVTVFRGVYAFLNPLAKYTALKSAGEWG
jgi:hypothetical protein